MNQYFFRFRFLYTFTRTLERKQKSTGNTLEDSSTSNFAPVLTGPWLRFLKFFSNIQNL